MGLRPSEGYSAPELLFYLPVPLLFLGHMSYYTGVYLFLSVHGFRLLICFIHLLVRISRCVRTSQRWWDMQRVGRERGGAACSTYVGVAHTGVPRVNTHKSRRRGPVRTCAWHQVYACSVTIQFSTTWFSEFSGCEVKLPVYPNSY